MEAGRRGRDVFSTQLQEFVCSTPGWNLERLRGRNGPYVEGKDEVKNKWFKEE